MSRKTASRRLLRWRQRDGSHLPWLRFKESSSSTSILAAGGRHHRAALIDWIKTKRSRLSLARRDLKDLEAKQRDEPGSVDEEDIRGAESFVEHLLGLVTSGGSWIVDVYDKSERTIYRIMLQYKLTLTPPRQDRRFDRHSSVDQSTQLQLRGDDRRSGGSILPYDEV